MTGETLREIAPYVLLAEKIGSFLAQRSSAPLRTLELTVAGEIARSDASHVRLALLVGVLRHGSETADQLRQRARASRASAACVLLESREEAANYTSLVRVRARSKRRPAARKPTRSPARCSGASRASCASTTCPSTSTRAGACC